MYRLNKHNVQWQWGTGPTGKLTVPSTGSKLSHTGPRPLGHPYLYWPALDHWENRESKKEKCMCGWKNKGQHIRMMALCIITLNMEPRLWFITVTGLTSHHGHFCIALPCFIPFSIFLPLPFTLSFSFHGTLTWRQENSHFSSLS